MFKFLVKLKPLYTFASAASKSYAYAKLMQKTGLTPPELDLYKEAYKTTSKALNSKVSIFIKKTVISKRAKLA